MNLIITNIIILFFISSISQAASFDCRQAKQNIEKTICMDSKLSSYDERVSKLYFKLYGNMPPTIQKDFKDNQRQWLSSRLKVCSEYDSKCLIKVYRDRFFELRKKDMKLVPYKPTAGSSTGADFQGISGKCNFNSVALPKQYKVFAGGSYKGKKADFQVDDSGHQATQFDVVVNVPNENVALILGAYEPSVWNIGWAVNTNIVAVYVTGYHRQKVIGLPRNTPLIISSDKGAACGRSYITAKKLSQVNPLSRKIFGRNADLVNLSNNGKLVFGQQLNDLTNIVSSNDTKLSDVIDKNRPKAGKAGLTEAVRKGILRPARKSDFVRWGRMMAKMNKEDIPPVVGGNPEDSYMPRYTHNPYVVLKAFKIPAGLYGGNSAQFFVEKGVPYPEGKRGHSDVYDFNTMTCQGTSPSCRRH